MLKPGSLVFTPGSRSTSTIGRSGGSSSSVRIGGGHAAVAIRTKAWTSILWCTSPSRMPQPTPPGQARSCRQRPSGNMRRAVASMAPSSHGATRSRRAAFTWPTPGRAHSRGEPRDRWLRENVPGRSIPAQRIRSLRHDRQRLGMDHRLVLGASCHGCTISLLHPRGSARRSRSGQLRCAQRITANSTQGRQGWLAPLRPQLLPSLSPGRRHAQPIDTGMSHVGFRCVVRQTGTSP